MLLPLIDGPCLVRDAIPLSWEVAATEPANDWEMSRYLQVLAEFEQPCDVLDERPSSAKLDLTLLWLARSLNTHMPQPTSATLISSISFIAKVSRPNHCLYCK